LNVVAVVDPLSAGAQRAATLLAVLRDRLGLAVTLALAPAPEVSALPLKSFYRLVMGESACAALAADGAASAAGTAASARFTRLPRQHVLTLRLETPEAWNVQSMAAVQDADNLRCEAGAGSTADCGDVPGSDVSRLQYTLKDLLVSGQCFETRRGGGLALPQGLQLILRPADISGTAVRGSDTVVMQNLGYFQLKANPGVWALRLAPGRGSDLYEMSAPPARFRGDGGFESEADTNGAVATASIVAVRDFYSSTERLGVRKRKGMENVPLLEDISSKGDATGAAGGGDAAATGVAADAVEGKGPRGGPPSGRSRKGGGGMWSSLKRGLFGDGDGDAAAATDTARSGGDNGTGSGAVAVGVAGPPETMHIFSLATGHLYERFLKIMMLSVTKRASMPVKFWLLENYLSPPFKASAAAMAEAGGFEVGYVTYKWPGWLRQQTDKQRIIWGYKILFLDVLFPLDVKKVIYVDADQVVRADLAELWRLDLQGRPYGYTPFCSSREETLGYQFWRGGFWKNHLGPRPYHISALYVVDLVRFRRTAVADELRSIYSTLSR
ncbi:unnamed protein product, partial [Phaeothamnion confervicola]